MEPVILTVIISTMIILSKLKQYNMSAETKLDELLTAIGDVIALIEQAFVGTGDLTEAEVDEKVTPILDRLRAIVPANG